VPLGGEQAAQMMRAAARFQRRDATPKTFDKARHRTSPHLTPQNNPARRVQTRQTAGVLAKINSNYEDVRRPVPLYLTSTILKDRGERAGHPIITNDSSDSTSFPTDTQI
jgi:hypothetical protein